MRFYSISTARRETAVKKKMIGPIRHLDAVIIVIIKICVVKIYQDLHWL